jgi:hypothetical protein
MPLPGQMAPMAAAAAATAMAARRAEPR